MTLSPRLFGAACCLAAIATVPASAGIVRFTATIDAAQETTGSTSTATGSAVLLYDVEANRFDLAVTINGFANPLTNSHIHEAAPGVAGPVVTGLGAEVAYTRNGDSLAATFLDVAHLGSPATLLSGGAYLNFHTAAYPGGEIRGQLIPDDIKLTARIDGSQESSANDSAAYGAAQAIYHPATNQIDVTVFAYNFTNTFTNSHIHEGPVGVSGGVVTPFGGAAVYTRVGNTYTNAFTGLTYGGNPVVLLSDGSYVNIHSNIYPAGEIRGQLLVASWQNPGRLVNVSARGQVNTGDGVLISGFIVQGDTPVRVLATARGPFLTGFGVSGALADPMLSIRDSAGVELLANDNHADAPYTAWIAASGLGPTDAAEAAILLILPPGAYTGVISGAGATTGVGLAEAYELGW